MRHPGFMSKERAQWLIDNRLLGGWYPMAFVEKCALSLKTTPEGMTEKEMKDIKAVWSCLPGYSTFHSALVTIRDGDYKAKGKDENRIPTHQNSSRPQGLDA